MCALVRIPHLGMPGANPSDAAQFPELAQEAAAVSCGHASAMAWAGPSAGIGRFCDDGLMPGDDLVLAVTHDLTRGGAHRRLREQVGALGMRYVEYCPETAQPISPGAVTVRCGLVAPRAPRLLRPPLRYADIWSISHAWRTISREIGAASPDVVYANPCRFVQAPPLRLPAHLPVVYFCDEPRRVDHEAQAMRSRNPRTRWVYSRLYAREALLDRQGVARADVIVTNSRYTAERIAEAYGRDARVLPLGVSDVFIRSGESDARSRELECRPFVLSVGTLIPTKGHELVVRAAAESRLRPGVAVVAPRLDESHAGDLRDLAGSLGVDLRFHIGISDDALAQLYGTACALLYLARLEPFGLASLEAQACGCPAIVAAEGGLPETVADGESGLVVPRDACAVGAAIDVIANRPERFRPAARAFASTMTWERSATALQEVLREVARR
jgi:glycosyltransferase involved in cell wall biosynthesis